MNILLHICCANCAIYPVKVLREQNHQVTGFFFNPNIHPYQEFKRRLDTVRDYAERTELPMAYRDDYLLEEFLAQTAAAPGSRCGYCYHSRMEEAARFAAGNGFEGFSTSLLYSRFQKHETIREYGQALAHLPGASWARASGEPTITASAPQAIALVMSPERPSAPSAMTWT